MARANKTHNLENELQIVYMVPDLSCAPLWLLCQSQESLTKTWRFLHGSIVWHVRRHGKNVSCVLLQMCRCRGPGFFFFSGGLNLHLGKVHTGAWESLMSLGWRFWSSLSRRGWKACQMKASRRWIVWSLKTKNIGSFLIQAKSKFHLSAVMLWANFLVCYAQLASMAYPGLYVCVMPIFVYTSKAT